MARSRTTSADLVRLLQQSPDPVYFLDDQRSIVFCNQACCQWTGVEAEDLVGRRVDYVAGDESSGTPGVAAGLCPPPEAFAGKRITAHVTCMSREGRLLYRRARFLPLGEGTEECVGVLAMIEGDDLSAADLQAELEDETRPQHEHLKVQRFLAAQQHRYGLEQLIGDSPALRRARSQVVAAAQSLASTVVVGPRGSGRAQVAHAIHYRVDVHQRGPLVPIDCSLLDADLLQATLETHLRRSEGENPSTLLFSEADQLTKEAQARVFDCLSSATRRHLIVSTSRESLSHLANQGTFQSDLAGLMSTLEIRLPALAQRVDDLPELAQMFLEECNRAGGNQVGGFSSASLDMLCGYPWPENLDELAEVVRCAHQSATSHLIEVEDLPELIHFDAQAAEFPRPIEEPLVLEDFLGEIEKSLILWTLDRCKGNKSKAAESLGMSRPRFYRRIEQLELDQGPESEGPSEAAADD